MKNIVLFGGPGAGKGTQAAKLKEKYSLNHISTGEVIRAEIAAETPLGKSMKDYIERIDEMIGRKQEFLQRFREYL